MRKFRWLQYDLSMFIAGGPIKNAVMGSFVLSRQLMIPPNAPDSRVLAQSAGSTGNYTMYLKQFVANDNYASGAIVGSIYFAQGSKVGVLTVTSGINFMQGDMLQVITDDQIPPEDLEDITIVILGFSVLRT